MAKFRCYAEAVYQVHRESQRVGGGMVVSRLDARLLRLRANQHATVFLYDDGSQFVRYANGGSGWRWPSKIFGARCAGRSPRA